MECCCMDRRSTRDRELLELLSTPISDQLNELESNSLAPTPHSATSWIQAEMHLIIYSAPTPFQSVLVYIFMYSVLQ